MWIGGGEWGVGGQTTASSLAVTGLTNGWHTCVTLLYACTCVCLTSAACPLCLSVISTLWPDSTDHMLAQQTMLHSSVYLDIKGPFLPITLHSITHSDKLEKTFFFCKLIELNSNLSFGKTIRPVALGVYTEANWTVWTHTSTSEVPRCTLWVSE